jgi:hypothetical protein
MRNNKFLRIVILTKGIFMLLMGIVHVVVAFTFEHNKLAGLPQQFVHDYLVWFIGVGFFLMFVGAIDLINYKDLTFKLRSTWKNIFINSLFSLILGGGLTAYFQEGPPILGFVVGLVAIVPVWLQRRDFSL